MPPIPDAVSAPRPRHDRALRDRLVQLADAADTLGYPSAAEHIALIIARIDHPGLR